MALILFVFNKKKNYVFTTNTQQENSIKRESGGFFFSSHINMRLKRNYRVYKFIY